MKGSLSVRSTQCGLLYKQGSPASPNVPIFLFDLWPFGGKKKKRSIMKWQLVIADFMTGGRGIVKYLISGLSETEAL